VRLDVNGGSDVARRGVPRSRRWRRASCASAAGLVLIWYLTMALPASADIGAVQSPVIAGVEITAHGVLWNDYPVLYLLSRDGASIQVSPSAGVGAGRGDFVAVGMASGGLGISRLAAPPSSLPVGPSIGPGGCRDWVADPNGRTSSLGASFTVSGEELILAGSPACRRITPSTPRPLFARPLAPGGQWRILRWLPNSTQPRLSARGRWLAVAIPRVGGRMLAQVVDASSGRLRNSLHIPDAYLAIAESGALVAAVGDITFNEYNPPSQLPYKMLYAAPGSAVARPFLPKVTVYGIPAVSDGHVAYELGSPFQTSTLAVTNVRTHATRLIAGFRGMQRQLADFDLDGEELAWTQADAQTPPPPRPPGLPCTIGPYVPPPLVTLHLADLGRPAAFVAAPPQASPAPPTPVTPCSTEQPG
jgi:hypothetical protein